MASCTLYTFDSTGHIGGRSGSVIGSAVPADGILSGNTLTVSQMIPATVTVTQPDGSTSSYGAVVDSGWSFVLDGTGAPTRDAAGNLVVVPPAYDPGRPSVAIYNLVSAVKSGVLDPKTDIDQDTINDVNRSLSAAGLPILPGTTLVPAPRLPPSASRSPTGSP
ncbi:hypothetical protein [Fimbriiglobus ruber]|uniref:Uncharacterized protein n=1 Tax=Fimbriiglobus ruber TaxID=1908690 RepID=A0A225D5M4_9BACT|nr:hypothetical protein [Fimbriiglobus ruber]OWK36880.1 hypothetical protein FRUB_07932 [Fimbriiglobus ruber]